MSVFLVSRACALLILALTTTSSSIAQDIPLMRTGITRAEVEASIQSPLKDDAESLFRSAYLAAAATPALRRQLPAPLSALDFETSGFYFNANKKLWRVRLATTLPAGDALAVVVQTARLMAKDKRLKSTQSDSVLQASEQPRSAPPKVCWDESDTEYKLSKRTRDLLAVQWKKYSQAERMAVGMHCGSDSISGHDFVTRDHVWYSVTFESAQNRGNEAEFQKFLSAPIRGMVSYIVVQASAATPDIDGSETTMLK